MLKRNSEFLRKNENLKVIFAPFDFFKIFFSISPEFPLASFFQAVYNIIKVKESQSQIGGVSVRISDLIAHYIEQELERQDGSVQLSRGELAEHFNCVPSQINYVLTTRFTPEHGYTVDSRRGGGGYIRITRVHMDRTLLMMHVINAIGPVIDAQSATAFLQNLLADGVLDLHTASVIHAAFSDAVLRDLPRESRDTVRASIMKQCLLACAQHSER